MNTATVIAAVLATAVLFQSFGMSPKYTGEESTKPKRKKMAATSPRAMQQITLAAIERYTQQKAARDADEAAEALRLGKEDTTGSALAEVKPAEATATVAEAAAAEATAAEAKA